ncbi:unnamed protein product, partial [Medioppia subpectinata]
PIATAVDTAIRALAMAHIVPNRVRRLSGASADTSPTITPVHSDMEISDIDDSTDLLDPPEGGADPPADDPLPDEEFYKNFDSLVDRVSDLIGANTASAADDHDVKPLIAAEDHTVIALDIKPEVKPDVKLDIKSDIKPDMKPIADNSAPDMTSNNASLAPGDSVSHIVGQLVIKQLKNDMSDQTLIDVKPLLIDPSLHTVSDQSLATTLSTQTEETASVEPIVTQIPPLIVNDNTNANRAEQSCVGTTPIGAIISDTDSQRIATTNHKKSVTNTIEEVIVRQEMGVNSGQELSAHLTAPADDTNQSFSSISSTESNPTPNSGHKNCGKKVVKESIPAPIGPQRERHLTLEYYRRRKKRLREAFRAKRGVDFTDSDSDSDSDANSDHSLTPFDGLLRDVSKRMASKTTSFLKTVVRSPPKASTSTATDTTRRSRSLTSRDGSAHSASSQLPEPLPTVSSTTSERRRRTRGRSSTLSDGELIDDESQADSEPEYECRECRQPFGHNRYEYNEHQYVIHGERHPYRCDYDDPHRPLDKRCGKQYDRAFDYVHHQRRQHDLRVRYECEYSGCDQYFDHRSAIKEHIHRAHGKQLPFVCDRADCGQSFGRETQLYAHKRDDHYHVRNGRQKADSLEVTVPLAFRGSRSAPDGHNEGKHCGDYHKCDAKDCGRSFVTKKLLNLHKLRLHSEPIVDQSVPKPTLKICQYECDYMDCFGMFATEEILQKHKMSVHQKHDHLLTSAPDLPTVSIDSTISVTTTRSQLTTGGVTLTDTDISDVISETIPALDTIGSTAVNDIRVPENTTGTFLNDWPVLTATDPLPVQPVATTSSTGPSMTTTDGTDRSPHTTPAFKCDKCPKRFHWERNLKQHKLTVHRRAPNTSATRSLAAPIVPKTSTRSPFTSVVPKASTSAATNASVPTTAAANSAAPVAAKPVFRCDKCAKRFRYEYNLIQHKLSAHSLALPYRCRYEGCDNAYGTKYLLHLHLIEHRIDSRTLNSRLKVSTRTARRSPATSTVPKASTGTTTTATDTVYITTPNTAATDSTAPVAAKPVFRCDKCTKRFRYEYNLKHHKLYAHCDQPLTYRCRYDGCANTFATKYLLNLHLIEFKSHRIAGHTDSSLKTSAGTTSRSQATSAVAKTSAGTAAATDTKATNHCLSITYRCRYEGCANPYASKALLNRHLRLFESHRIDSRTLNSQPSVANTGRDGGRNALLPTPAAESAGELIESRTLDSESIAGSTSRSGQSTPSDECDGELECRDCDARFLTLRALTAHKCAPLFGAPACDVDLRDPSVQHCDRDYRERLHLNYPCDYDGCRTEFSSLSLLNAHKQDCHWTQWPDN